MNKDGYIRQVNDIKAPEDLKMKISDIGKSAPKKKKGKWKAAVVAAACTVLVFTAVMPLFAGSLKAAQSDGSMNYAQEALTKIMCNRRHTLRAVKKQAA